MNVQRLPFDGLWFVRSVAPILQETYGVCNEVFSYSMRKRFDPRINVDIDKRLFELVTKHIRDYDTVSGQLCIGKCDFEDDSLTMDLRLGTMSRGTLTMHFLNYVNPHIVSLENPWKLIDLNIHQDVTKYAAMQVRKSQLQ